MIVEELLAELARRGVRLWIEGGTLRFRSPKGALSEDLRAQIAAAKPQIVERLAHSGGRIEPQPRDRHEPFPLSDLQEAYWLGGQPALELGGISAHSYLEVEAEGPGVPEGAGGPHGIDLLRLEEAFRRLVDRHDMLRAVVLADVGGNGRQRVLETVAPFRLAIIDVRLLPPNDVAASVERARRRMLEQGPPFDRWPPFEVVAHLLPANRIRLHLSISLFVVDGWSAKILLGELLQLYLNPAAALPPLPITFRDYLFALDRETLSERHRQAREHWLDRIDSLPPAPDLPLAAAPRSLGRPSFRRRIGKLEPAEWARFTEHARRFGVTPTAALASVYAEALATWSRAPWFTLNFMFFNRRPLHPAVSRIVGNFSSTLLLEVDLREPVPFAEQARRLLARMWKDIEHGHFSGVRAVREWNRRRGAPAGAIAAPVVFNSALFGSGEETGLPAGVQVEVIHGGLQTPQVWLDHQVVDIGGALHLVWDAVDGLFPDGMIDDLVEAQLRRARLLASDAGAWERPGPSLVPPAQLDRRAAVNATAAPVPETMLHTLFEERARERPEAVAVSAGRRTLSYRELDDLSGLVARWLVRHGAGPDALIPVVMEKGWEQVVAVLGVLRAGAAYLPIEASNPAARIRYLLGQTDLGITLTQSWLDDRIPWDGIKRLHVDVAERTAAAEPAANRTPRSAVTPKDLAYVIYTSGTTGVPKGVMIAHRGAVNTVLDVNSRFRVGPEDRALAISSLGFDLSVYDVFGLLAAGGTIVIPDASPARTRRRIELLEREGVTIWSSVPALMQVLVDSAHARGRRLPRSLRLVLLSGDWIPLDLPRRIRALADHDLEIISLGGATEASIWSILQPIDDIAPQWRSIPYGRPMANQTFHVLDEKLQPRPVWVPGGLYIGGIGLADGYWRDAELTSARFLMHPQTGERLYRTGDLGRYLPDGTIELLGREDLQVKVNGMRIELGEIEATLEHHPSVRSAVVLALGSSPDARDRRLVAYVVPRQDATVDPAALAAFAGERLPDYMVPSVIVPMAELPLTANGKVDRRALPPPEPVRANPVVTPPRNDLESRLVALWEELLQKKPIGIHDDFFALGGDSLLSMRLMARVERELGRRLALAELFSCPTVAHLAEMLDRAGGSATVGCLVALRAGGDRPPLFLVHPVGGNVVCYLELARRLPPSQPVYALQSVGLDGDERPLATIEEMASEYLRAVQSVQPAGPYRMGGWSLGGVVAFEMARQLEAHGEMVEAIVLIDSPAPAMTPDAGEGGGADEDGLVADFVRDLARGRDAPRASLAVLAGRAGGNRLVDLFEAARSADLIPPEMELPKFERLLNVFLSNSLALRSYAPTPHPGTLTLLRADEPSVLDPVRATARRMTDGWAGFAAKVEQHSIPGDHYRMLTGPGLAVVIERLEDVLGSARGRK